MTHYQVKRRAYTKNIEKLLPFYNKATIVKYGNLVNENSLLYQKNSCQQSWWRITVIHRYCSNKQTANKLLLHYQDHSSETFDLKYQTDFAKLANISEILGFSYINQFLYDMINMILTKWRGRIIIWTIETHGISQRSRSKPSSI